MALVTFGMETTTGWDKLGRQRAALALVLNSRAGNRFWDRLGRQRDATRGNGFGNFRAGNHYWDKLGRQRKAMDLITFELGITTGTRLGGNGRQ